MTAVLIIALLILANGLFVAAEFALIGAPRATIEQRASQGSRLARHVLEVISNPKLQDRYIATAQLGITFASLGLGMYGEHTLAARLYELMSGWGWDSWLAAHSVASGISIVFLTYLHIVLGEMVPKSLALLYAERLSLLISKPMHCVYLVFYPLVLVLNTLGNTFLKLMGLTRKRPDNFYHSPKELQYIIEESQQQGLLKEEEARVMKELFDFNNLMAHEVMTPRVRVQGIPYGATAAEVRQLIRNSRHTRYPVYKNDLDHVVGMIHTRDIFLLLRRHDVLSDRYIRPVPFIPVTTRLENVFGIIRENRSHMVIVMDEYGGMAGLLTKEDVFAEVVEGLEENSSGLPEGSTNTPGSCRVPGTMRLDELGEKFGEVLSHEEVDTVSGLILMFLERPAQVGDVAEYKHFRMEVQSVHERGVEECLVTRLEPPVTDDISAESGGVHQDA